ncbi:MAG: peptide chain release factor N(5)-glutamine methyltransferase [Pseudomonadota bacterium]
MTVAEAIREACERLSATSDTARLDAEVLMAHALDSDRSEMLLRETGRSAPTSFFALVERRANREPIAYITGFQEFYGRSFVVTQDTLIPRLDSETLVEAALEAMDQSALPVRTVLDLGTGSGALLLSVLAERPDCRGFGLDNSAAALAVARTNALRFKLEDRVSFGEGSWHEENTSWGFDWPEEFDLILANPPYVESGAKLDPQVMDFEPHAALFAGPEGLDAYRAIAPHLGLYLAKGGKAIFEIGAIQARSVTEIAEKAGFAAELRRDLANRPRVLILS